MVRLGIGHEPDTIPSQAEWNTIEALAKQQGLLAIIFDGIKNFLRTNDDEQPQGLIHRVSFKYHRWKANVWKRELCYAESERSSFLGGVWNLILKPSSI